MFSSSLVPDSVGFSPHLPVLHFHLQTVCLGQRWSPAQAARNRADSKKFPALSSAQLPAVIPQQWPYPCETPPVPAPGAEAMGHHLQLSQYCHFLTETAPALARDFQKYSQPWDCCPPWKSPSYHYSPAHKAPKIPKPQTLQHPAQLKHLSHSWGHQSSLHPHQQRLLLVLLLQEEGGLVLHSLICFCCSHHLPNPFTPADISKCDLFFCTQMTKSFSPIMLWTQLHVSHCSSATHGTQAGWIPWRKVFTSGQSFSLKKIITNWAAAAASSSRREAGWALCNTEAARTETFQPSRAICSWRSL